MTVVSPRMGTDGWPFASVDSFPDADTDPLYGSEHVKDLYIKADPNYGGRLVVIDQLSRIHLFNHFLLRFTVPVLWDKKNETIVNNESSEILRIFNTAFNHLLPADKAAVDLYPEELRSEIDSLNEWIYPNINSKSPSSELAPPRPECSSHVCRRCI